MKQNTRRNCCCVLFGIIVLCIALLLFITVERDNGNDDCGGVVNTGGGGSGENGIGEYMVPHHTSAVAWLYLHLSCLNVLSFLLQSTAYSPHVTLSIMTSLTCVSISSPYLALMKAGWKPLSRRSKDGKVLLLVICQTLHLLN